MNKTAHLAAAKESNCKSTVFYLKRDLNLIVSGWLIIDKSGLSTVVQLSNSGGK